MSPTDCSAEASRLRMARRLGSAMMLNVDSMERIYLAEYIAVKAHDRACRSGYECVFKPDRYAGKPGCVGSAFFYNVNLFRQKAARPFSGLRVAERSACLCTCC